MDSSRRDRDALAETVRSPGYTPARKDVEAVAALLADADDAVADAAEKALVRAGEAAVPVVIAGFGEGGSTLRARLARVASRLAVGSPEARALVLAALADADARVRRAAARGLGLLDGAAIEDALLARLAVEDDPSAKRALVASLGKVGAARTHEALATASADDAETARVLAEARVRARRATASAREPTLREDEKPARAVTVRYRTRLGLEPTLIAEIPRWNARASGPGQVDVRRAATLRELAAPRTALSFAFPLAPVPIDGDEGAALARALGGDEARAIFAAYAAPPIRYRIEWPGAGHRRAATLRAADALARSAPDLVNDPSESDWEVDARIEGDALAVELRPKGLADTRFTYRKGDVFAASHPTIAAALARVAGPRDREICWDPFAGSALDLCERVLLGGVDAVYASDVDESALAVARANLEAVGAPSLHVARGDVRVYRPRAAVTLVLTNPPMGRRVLSRRDLGPLYDALFLAASDVLVDDGRVAWLTPLPEPSLDLAARHGFVPRFRQRVDMGGFDAELQVLSRARAPRRSR